MARSGRTAQHGGVPIEYENLRPHTGFLHSVDRTFVWFERPSTATRISLLVSAVQKLTGIRSDPLRRTPSSRNPEYKADAIFSFPGTTSTPHIALSLCP